MIYQFNEHTHTGGNVPFFNYLNYFIIYYSTSKKIISQTPRQILTPIIINY